MVEARAKINFFCILTYVAQHVCTHGLDAHGRIEIHTRKYAQRLGGEWPLSTLTSEVVSFEKRDNIDSLYMDKGNNNNNMYSHKSMREYRNIFCLSMNERLTHVVYRDR